jgi:hypothetical protein
MESGKSIGGYLLERIYDGGARHVFGVPGDHVLDFFKNLIQSPLHVITTCDEQGAGFAVGAYARTNGFGVVCVTYGVGGLKITDTTWPGLRREVAGPGHQPALGEGASVSWTPCSTTRYTSSTTR